MKRLAYALTFVLVVGLLAGGFVVRAHRPDGRALLLSAAEAMEAADTVHVVFRGTEGAPDTPTGLRLMPGQGEMWVSDRVVAMRYSDSDGNVWLNSYMDADQLTWWTYDRTKRILYQADLGPIREEVLSEILTGINRLLRGGQITEVELGLAPDAELTTAREVRNGRRVDVVTIIYTLPTESRHVMARRIFEIDPATHRLIGGRRYAWTEGIPEELIDSIDEVKYNESMPPDLDVPAVPRGTETVAADVSAQETGTTLSLVMALNGKEIERADVVKTK